MKRLNVLIALMLTIGSSYAQNPIPIWQQSIGGSGNDGLGKVEDPTSDEYFLIGSSDSNISGDKTDDSRGLSDIWIVKMDANNAILWDKTIGGDQFEWVELAQVINNQLFILCRSNSSISGEKTIAPYSVSGTYDQWLLCCDLSGNILWQRLYGGDQDEFVSDMLLLPNNNLLLGITSESGISGNKTEDAIGGQDLWFVEISTSNGDIVSQKTVGSDNNEIMKDMLLSSNGNILILSRSETGASGDKSDSGYGQWDVWLIEMDMNFNVLQDKCFGGSGQEDTFGGAMIYQDGYYYMATSSSSDPSGNKTASYRGSFDAFERDDYWILKLDPNFDIVWDVSFGGTADDFCSGLFFNAWNKLVISGNSESGISGGVPWGPFFWDFGGFWPFWPPPGPFSKA